jgi:hypothetical protein
VDAAQWQTPRVTTGEYTRDGGQTGKERLSLEGEAANWPTPGANDHKGSAKDGQRRGQLDEAAEQIHSPLSRPDQESVTAGPPSSPSTPTSRPRLNPNFVDWLMGCPIRHTAI